MKIDMDDEKSMRRYLEAFESGDPIRDFYDEFDIHKSLAEAIERLLGNMAEHPDSDP